MITINSLIDIIKDIANRHQMVHDFDFGSADNFASKRAMKFPYVWLEPRPSTMEIANGVIVNYYSFTLYCFDRLSKGDENYDDTFSDTDYILNTFIAMLSKHPKYRALGIPLQDKITKNPVHEATDDNVNGWAADLTFKVNLPLNQCSVPIDCCEDC